MILLLVAPSWALDAHGSPATPSVGESAASPLVAWEAGAPPTGVAITGQGARHVAMTWPDDGGDPDAQLDELVGFEVGGSYRLGRFGITASLPLWEHYTGLAGDFTGVAPGDLRVGVPVTLLDRDTLTVGLRAEGVAPTGKGAALLGGGWGGGLHATVGRNGTGLVWTVGVGAAGDSAATFANVDRTVTLPVSAQVGYGGDRLGGGLEAWFSPSLTASESPWSSAPAEVLARLGLRTDSGLSAALAGGYAVSPGIGAAGGRVLLRVGWSQPAKQASAKPVARRRARAGATDVVVQVHAPDGKPIDASVRPMAEGSAPGDPVRTGPDGEAIVPLGVGSWSVEVSATGRQTQLREVRVAADAWRPARVEAVLPPAEAGSADLTVRVVDASGERVDRADVRVDGATQGATSTGGTVTLTDLAPRERTVTVVAEGYAPSTPLVIPVGAADEQREVTLLAAPGAVRVLARVGDAPATEAFVRFLGTGDPSTPAQLGDDGEGVFQLRPGRWTVVVTAPTLGVHEREIVVEPGATSMVVIDVRMARDAGEGQLGVRVIDPEGAPVPGAEVLLDGASVGRTSTGGTVRVGGIAPGSHALTATGERIRAVEPLVVELQGPRDVDLVVGWAPGTVAIRARGPEDEPVDAEIRFDGASDQPDYRLGADGEGLYGLPPGDWTVIVSAATLGLQERSVHLDPDGVARVDIEAGLLRDAGRSSLALVVRGPPGAPVAGATVRIDDRDAGTVGGTGRVVLGGLAPGKHHVEVDGADVALGTWSRDYTLGVGQNPAEARLGWAERAVRVRASAAGSPVADVVARAVGASDRAAVPLGADGEAVVNVDAGPGWDIIGSSPAFGVLSAPVPPTDPAQVDLSYTPPSPGVASLLVVLEAPDGRLVNGARAWASGTPAPAEDGVFLLSPLPPGRLALRLEAPGYTPTVDELVLVEGAQERHLRMAWLPRPVSVTVEDGAGAAVDAEVRLIGPDEVRLGATGPDGEAHATAYPGDWQVVASAAAYGARSVPAPVPPGEGPVAFRVTLDAPLVAVHDGELQLDGSFQFAFDSATIEPSSRALLEQLAAALQLHPEILRVEIQGHTDDKGDPVYNLDLSQRRADAVRGALVAAGVAPRRLVARGYGATVPVAPNTTEAGRRANRRVRFLTLAME